MLSKGLKFAPVPQSNIPELKSDINSFTRRLRLREMFGNSQNDDESLVRNKSIYTPKSGKDEFLDSYIDVISRLPIKPNKYKQNISRDEQQALNNLKNDANIIIKQADKGGAIVIMDKSHYKEMVLEQLNDTEYYKKLNKNPDKATAKRIKKLVGDHSCLTDKEIAYLCDFVPKQSNFYGLPKIHKSKDIQNAVCQQNKPYIEVIQPADLKLRPIVAGPDSTT